MATLQGCLGYKQDSDIDFLKMATVVKLVMSHKSLSVPRDVSSRGFIRQRGRGGTAKQTLLLASFYRK